MNSKDNRITAWLDANSDKLIEIASQIHANPEIAFEETCSCESLASYLAENGFAVELGLADIPTAFAAEWGSGKPVIGFLAEYDALPGLGHACGHNLLGTAVCAAAIALRDDMLASGASGTIRVYGTPAEEIMSGKIVMNDAGCFDDLDVAVTWHPFDRNRISNDIWPAIDIKNYTFSGVAAHASKSPELGRSALDAAEIMNVGVNYLREHVSTDVRMHYAYVDNGIPANIVPNRAKTNFFIRSPKRSHTQDASKRVDDCARGAAIMTGTSVDIELVAYCDEMKVNRPLVELYYEAMKQIPTPTYDDAEMEFAKQITEEAGLENGGKYFTGLCELEDEPEIIFIGTDASQVSHTVPLITISAQTMVTGTPLHHWATEKQAGMSIGWKGMLYAARCMAEGTKLLMETPGAIEKAWEYHRANE
ncbi:MAG: amidohydrolase [Firmicutes bacterium]|nr:amidohydrolase [Bacillota bacterium]